MTKLAKVALYLMVILWVCYGYPVVKDALRTTNARLKTRAQNKDNAG